MSILQFPFVGDGVTVFDAVETDIYDVSYCLRRWGRIIRANPWCGDHMYTVQFPNGQCETFFYEELDVRRRQGKPMPRGVPLEPLPLPETEIERAMGESKR